LYERDVEKDICFVKYFERAGDDVMDILYPYSAVLWLRIMRYAGYDNTIALPIREISEALQCSATTATRALKELKEKGYIKLHSGTRGVYLVNPWKATRVSPAYRVALEEAWTAGTAKNVRRRMEEIADEIKIKRKERRKAEIRAEEEPTLEQVEAIANRYLSAGKRQVEQGEQLFIEERIKNETKRQRNAERQRRFRARQKQKALQASA
jgi:DNA-binding transcriptional MocR family regulator